MDASAKDLEFYQEREKISLACRVMAMEGIVEGTLGHISMRVGEDRMLIRSRGPEDCGLFFSQPEEICLFDFSGNLREEDRGYIKPVELPLHGETLRRRAGVNVVVHAHPPAVLAATLANLHLLPAFGSYGISANQLATEGIPIFSRSILISSKEIADQMLDTMGDHRACVLKGHGITVVGTYVEEALLTALNVNTLAKVALEVAKARATLKPIPPEDQALVPRTSKFSPESGWKFYEAKLRRYGYDK